MALNSANPSLLALISTGDLAANKIFYHASCYKSMQYKSDKFKCDKSSTDWNAEWKKAEELDRVVSYIIEHEEFNPGSVYVVKDIDQKYIEYLSESGILEQPNTTRCTKKKDINKKYIEYLSESGILEQPDATIFTKKLLLALPNLCSKIINKKSVVLFSDTVVTLVKDYIESLDDFFIALRKIVIPIRRELFEQENNFSDKLNLGAKKNRFQKSLQVYMNIYESLIAITIDSSQKF